jgi:drug/metabolite transporter (DMT)-like permease
MKPGGIDNRDPETYAGVDPFELSCFRTIFNCCTTFFVMTFLYKRKANDVPKNMYLTLLIRSLAGFIGFVSMTISVQWLPISIFTTVFNTMPFFISILSYFVL